MSDVEKRLERIEKMLTRILEKLKSLEELTSSMGLSSEAVKIAYELITLHSIPVVLAFESARRALTIISRLRLDPISREVVKALSLCKEMSVSEIARTVKESRGTASRRIVREKIKVLEELDAVVNVGTSVRPKFTLRSCLEKKQ